MSALCKTRWWLAHHSSLLQDLSMIFSAKIGVQWDYICWKFRLVLLRFHQITSLLFQWFHNHRLFKPWFLYKNVPPIIFYRLLKTAGRYDFSFESYKHFFQVPSFKIPIVASSDLLGALLVILVTSPEVLITPLRYYKHHLGCY